jgi:SAM-dependent methyltransferase
VTPAPADRAAHRAWLVSLTALPAGGTAVDLGCGRGEDLLLLAARHPDADATFVGVDASDESIAAAAAAAAADRRVSVRRARLDARLPFDAAALDLVYSHNLLECLPDPRAFALEVARVLRPGGQVVVAHWDWDSQLFDGPDRGVVRRLVGAYADWQQAWMAHADPWMGRRLWGVFNAAGAFAGEVHARVLTNTAFEAPWFGHENARAFRALVRRGLAAAEDCERFERAQAALHAEGRYVYAITGFAYVGRRAGGRADG